MAKTKLNIECDVCGKKPLKCPKCGSEDFDIVITPRVTGTEYANVACLGRAGACAWCWDEYNDVCPNCHNREGNAICSKR